MKRYLSLALALLLCLLSCASCGGETAGSGDGETTTDLSLSTTPNDETTATPPDMTESNRETAFISACIEQIEEWQITTIPEREEGDDLILGYAFADLNFDGNLEFIIQTGRNENGTALARVYRFDAAQNKIVPYTTTSGEALYPLSLGNCHLLYDIDGGGTYYYIMEYRTTQGDGSTVETWNKYFFGEGDPTMMTAWQIYRSGEEADYSFMDYEVEAEEYSLLVRNHIKRGYANLVLNIVDASEWLTLDEAGRFSALRSSYQAFSYGIK